MRCCKEVVSPEASPELVSTEMRCRRRWKATAGMKARIIVCIRKLRKKEKSDIYLDLIFNFEKN